MDFSFDSWPWKFALLASLLGARAFVSLLSPANARGEGGRWLIETLDSATIAIGLVLFVIQPFILQAFVIPSGSMADTLTAPPIENGPGGDRLLVSKVVYQLREPQAGDVIVFRAPPEAHPERPDDDFIKRCIGTPGHTVEAKGRTIFIDGRATKEPFQKWNPPVSARGYPLSLGYDMKILRGVVYSREYFGDVAGAVGTWHINQVEEAPPELQAKLNDPNVHSEPIPQGKYLMLGDHRNDSNDGHNWGLLDESRILGKAVCVFWPPTRAGLLDRKSERVRPANGANAFPLAAPTATPSVN